MSYGHRPYPPQRQIRAAMALRGYSVKDMANRTGLSYQYLVHLLNGYCQSDPALDKIWKAMGVITPENYLQKR